MPVPRTWSKVEPWRLKWSSFFIELLISVVESYAGDLLVIVEYCRYGNLQNFMLRHRNGFIHQVNERGELDSSIGAAVLAEASAR